MNVFACQFEIAWEAPEENFATVRNSLEQETVPAESLIVLPEMFATGFSMNIDRIADQPDTEPFLQALAKEYRSWVIGGTVTKAPDGRGLNQARVYDPDGVRLGHYDKIHPFSYSGEDRYYARGQSHQLFDLGGVRVCPLVCYDLRFPELFRKAALDGAELFAVIANWPEPRTAHWSTLLAARAIENQAFVIGVNRTGTDPKLSYSGHSAVIDPLGKILAEADDRVGCITADLDRNTLLDWRKRFPALDDSHQVYDPSQRPGAASN